MSYIPVIRCRDCGGTLLYERTTEGYEVIHSCKDGKQVREMFAAQNERIAQARLEEAKLWDQRQYICGEIDHAEGHKRFLSYCRVCARKRIAELEKAAKGEGV